MRGINSLGFHHRLVRARGRTGARRVTLLARWPSRQTAQHARDRIRELTDRSSLAGLSRRNALIIRHESFRTEGLGSAIAYDVLTSVDGAPQVDALLTVG